MPDVTIREARAGDALRMAEILREIGWSERRNALPLEEVAGPIEKLIEHCVRDGEGHSIIVASDKDDTVIGFLNVHWVPFIMLGSLEGYVSDVFVSPSSGGLGVGKALVERVIDEGKRRGCMRLMLTNGKEKLSYKTGFYKKLGWTERPSVANFVYYYQEPWS
jgi:GNAT superfamily N-acetyltransferase